MTLRTIINNLYGLEFKEIKDEYILSEYLFGERLKHEVSLIKQKSLSKKENQQAYDLLIMEVLTAYIENAKTINVNKKMIKDKFEHWSYLRGVYLGKKGVIVGDFALAKFLWEIDLRILKSFFKKNKDIAMSLLMDFSSSPDLDHFMGINANYLFSEIIKKCPDKSIVIENKFGNSLFVKINELDHFKDLVKKITPISLSKLLDMGSEKDDALESLSRIISMENLGFECFFKEKNRYDGVYRNSQNFDNLHNLYVESNFSELKKLEKKPFFVQLPNEKLNKKTIVSNFKNLYFLVEAMKETDYQMVLLISDEKNVRSNEAIVLENEILDHLAWSIKDARGSFFLYHLMLLLLKIGFKTFISLTIFSTLFNSKEHKLKDNFESRVLELNFQGKLKNDYLKILERMPVIHFENIEAFVKEYPDVIDKNGVFTEDGLDLFEMNLLY